jgi:two-component system phosphate regulon response regulator PhoB
VVVPNTHLADRLIVVVDDDARIRELFTMLLGLSRAKVIATGDPVGAEQLVVVTQPDIVLLDVDMPRLNGFQVAQRLQANPLTYMIPFIFVTGAGEMSPMHVSESGAAGLVPKPFDPSTLERTIDDVLTAGLRR